MYERTSYLQRIQRIPYSSRPRTRNQQEAWPRILAHEQPEQCERIYYDITRCTKPQRHGYCTHATGPIEVAIKRKNTIPDIHNNQPLLAYEQPCFSHSNYTLRKTRGHEGVHTSRRDKRFFFALLFSAIMDTVVENSLKSALDAQIDKYNDISNERLGGLSHEMNDGFNKIEGQIVGIRRQQAQLQHEISMLARFTSKLAGREQALEWNELAMSRQMIQQLVYNTRVSLENRQRILAGRKK